jgi:hypothetical protein
MVAIAEGGRGISHLYGRLVLTGPVLPSYVGEKWRNSNLVEVGEWRA